MDTNPDELRSRLDLIERMIAEGRRNIALLGWLWVVGGVGHLAALAWMALAVTPAWLPWAVLMPLCGVITFIGARRVRRERAGSSLGRAVGAIWLACTMPLLLVLTLLMWRCGWIAAWSMVFVLMGVGNAAVGPLLRSKVQVLIGYTWWIAAVIILVWPTPRVAMTTFAGIAIVGEVGFGVWLMAIERRLAVEA